MKTSTASSQGRIEPRHDCSVQKDVSHFYRAHWSRAPMVHIAGRRDALRPSGHASVKIYTNAQRVTLEVNGATFGVARPGRICVWHGVPLAPGSNTLTVRTDSGVTDTVVWDCAP